MLGDRYELNIKYNDKKYKLNINFKFLKNLNSLLQATKSNEDVFSYINKYISSDEKGNELDIIYCMLDGKIGLFELVEVINNLDDLFLKSLKEFVVLEMNTEDIFEEDKEEDDDPEEDKRKFLRYWDNNYYIAIHQLNMSYNKFLNSSPREILTLGKLHGDFYKNIIIKRDIAIAKAKANANEVEKEKVVKVTRLRDLFN